MDLRVGYAGSRTRYPVGMYEYVHKKSGRHANLSGTAIINQFITVSGILYPETVFNLAKKCQICSARSTELDRGSCQLC